THVFVQLHSLSFLERSLPSTRFRGCRTPDFPAYGGVATGPPVRRIRVAGCPRRLFNETMLNRRMVRGERFEYRSRTGHVLVRVTVLSVRRNEIVLGFEPARPAESPPNKART